MTFILFCKVWLIWVTLIPQLETLLIALSLHVNHCLTVYALPDENFVSNWAFCRFLLRIVCLQKINTATNIAFPPSLLWSDSESGSHEILVACHFRSLCRQIGLSCDGQIYFWIKFCLSSSLVCGSGLLKECSVLLVLLCRHLFADRLTCSFFGLSLALTSHFVELLDCGVVLLLDNVFCSALFQWKRLEGSACWSQP